MIVASLKREVAQPISRLTHSVKETLKEVLFEVGNAIVGDITRDGTHPAPYRTGNLISSYRVEEVGETEILVGNDVEQCPYAIYVELGTRKMAARPHLTPAAREFGAPLLNKRLKERLGI